MGYGLCQKCQSHILRPETTVATFLLAANGRHSSGPNDIMNLDKQDKKKRNGSALQHWARAQTVLAAMC